MPDQGCTWLASYPKSGNTWLRCLLEAYRRNGVLDINDIRSTTSDGGATLLQAISPTPLSTLDFRVEMLLRPAALFNLFGRLNPPITVKTHFSNIQPDGLPHNIPKEFTEKAVYVVRDPRSVISSFARFYNFPLDKAVESLNDKSFTIGGNGMFCRSLVSSWSNHVASWVSEKEFPVHVVKYEDMVMDTSKELSEVLEFMDIEVDEDLVKRAVEASDINKLRGLEEEDGFKENQVNQNGPFFNNGSVHWDQELGPKWIKRIEEDHGTIMNMLGYESAM